MAVVGAFARVDPGETDAARQGLSALPGVTTFELDAPEKVGVLIEAENIDAAHETLTRDVRKVEGVWGVWPVYVHHEEDEDAARQAVSDAASEEN